MVESEGEFEEYLTYTKKFLDSEINKEEQKSESFRNELSNLDKKNKRYYERKNELDRLIKETGD